MTSKTRLTENGKKGKDNHKTQVMMEVMEAVEVETIQVVS